MRTLDFYLSLFSPSVREKPRFMALAEAVLSQAADVMTFIVDLLPEAFSPEIAVGWQLDALGELLDVPRPGGNAPDGEYRLLLRSRIARHHWDGTNGTLPAVLEAAFPGRNARMTDNQDGTVTCGMDGEIPSVFTPKDLFPVPAGVRVREE